MGIFILLSLKHSLELGVAVSPSLSAKGIKVVLSSGTLFKWLSSQRSPFSLPRSASCVDLHWRECFVYLIQEVRGLSHSFFCLTLFIFYSQNRFKCVYRPLEACDVCSMLTMYMIKPQSGKAPHLHRSWTGNSQQKKFWCQ